MNTRERVRVALKLEVPDKVPITERGFWPETLARWHKEGLPKDTDPITYLEMDRLLSVSYNSTLGFEERILSETQDKIIKVDGDGATFVCWKNRSATPLPLDFLIKTKDDWLRYKERLVPDEKRLSVNFVENYEKLRETDGFIFLTEREPCWKVLAAMLGVKRGLMMMLREPQLVYDMIETYTDLLLGMYKIMIDKGVEIDGIWLSGDLAYKNGMLFSPKLYDSLVYPHHKRIASFFKSEGIPIVNHIDVDVRQYIPLIIKSGFSAIQPLEARANNDVRELKEKWGRKIAFIGNISADVLSQGTEEQIETEVRSKVSKAKEGGGYIFHSDHSVPPTVSWKNYCHAVRIAKEAGQY